MLTLIELPHLLAEMTEVENVLEEKTQEKQPDNMAEDSDATGTADNGKAFLTEVENKIDIK